MLSKVFACILVTFCYVGGVSAATFQPGFFGNPLVVSGPTEVFVTKLSSDIGFSQIDPITFQYTSIILPTDPLGTTKHFLTASSGPILWEIAGNAGFLIGDHPVGGGISSGITSVYLDLKNPSAGLLASFAGAVNVGSLGFGLGDTYAALTAAPGGGGGPSPIPLPAAGWMLLAGLGALAAAARRRAG